MFAFNSDIFVTWKLIDNNNSPDYYCDSYNYHYCFYYFHFLLACSSSCYNITPSSDIIYASIGDSFDVVVEHSELLSFNLYKESNGTGVFDIAVCNDSSICVVHIDAARFEIRSFKPELAGTYEYRYTNGTSFCATPFTISELSI